MHLIGRDLGAEELEAKLSPNPKPIRGGAGYRSAPAWKRGSVDSVARAFTLLELIVVMAIISIAIAMAVPSLHGFAQGRRAGNSADQITALLQWAHTQSITRSEAYRFNLDPGAGTFWITVEKDDGTVAPPAEEFGRTFTAPDGVTLSWDAPRQQDGQYIRFLPTGRTDPSTISVTDASGKVTQITCESATELFHRVADSDRQSP